MAFGRFKEGWIHAGGRMSVPVISFWPYQDTTC